MKKLTLLGGVILAFCLLLAMGSSALNQQPKEAGKVLNLYNWGDYIDPELLSKFEEETGYQVVYETFDSNESMYTKIKQGSNHYDLTIPSDYMVEKMKKDDLIQTIDKSKLDFLNQMDANIMGLSYDSQNDYSIPYFYGTLGIVYNDQYVKGENLKSFNDLWRPDYRQSMMLVDSARDIMGLSLISQGHSLNTTDSSQLNQAKEKLDKLAPNVKAIVADEMKMYMIQNEAAIGVTWSGEAAEMLKNNEHLHYVIPKEGSNLWVDNFVIPKSAQHLDAAYAFMNFMMKPENAARNSVYLGYSTPNILAKQELEKTQDPVLSFYPTADQMKHLEVFKDLGQDVVQTYNDLFLEFKMYRN
ncbi:ABC transporter substrate-binding protein [Holzapfeliella sp. He02]|uniref:ABC transporter substrate-binding protein n=1 Tax=Holzapfeliella saturejae TaxID=3082953 RepID=A0ABU8SFT6_9LACO